jgi:hypothetical protein
VPDDDRQYTAEEVDAAVEVLSDPERLRHAEAVMTHAAPALQRILNAALEEGGYLSASSATVGQASDIADPRERQLAIRTLLAEETRLGMLVGATVGFELARELARTAPSSEPPTQET